MQQCLALLARETAPVIEQWLVKGDAEGDASRRFFCVSGAVLEPGPGKRGVLRAHAIFMWLL